MLKKYTYKHAGVDIKKADEIINSVSSKFKIDNFQNFCGIYKNKLFNDYTFVSCCDGIGSKIIPLIKKNDPYTIASDLVAMNLNDLITLGAKPLFFLDYIAVNNIKNDIIEKTIEHLTKILMSYNCALLGGEISELPSLIKKNYFDIAGFIIGCYKKEYFLDKNNTKKGDVIIGLKSNGVHSNGFSLIRKLYKDKVIDEKIFNSTLCPTKIYYNAIDKLTSNKLIKSAANITGGGLYANIKRAVNDGLDIRIDFSSIPEQEIFKILKKYVIDYDKVFNQGAGFCVIADKNNVNKIMQLLQQDSPFILGEVI